VSNFDFKRYQNFQKSRKMVIRFIIYSVVIFILLYLIMKQDQEVQMVNEIDNFELDESNKIDIQND